MIVEIINDKENFLRCETGQADDTNKTKESEIYSQNLVKKFEKLTVLNKKDLNDSINALKKIKDPSQIADNIASNLNLQIFLFY